MDSASSSTNILRKEKGDKWSYEKLLTLEKSDFTYTSCYCEENIYLFIQDMVEKIENCDLSIKFFAMFISNSNKSCPIWFQKSSSMSANEPVIWDYHVVSLVKVSYQKKTFQNTKSNDNETTGGNSLDAKLMEGTQKSTNTKWLIYDLDTDLPFPVDAHEYFYKSFRPYLYYRFVKNPASGSISLNRIQPETSGEDDTSTFTESSYVDSKKMSELDSFEPVLRIVDARILLQNFASDRSHMTRSDGLSSQATIEGNKNSPDKTEYRSPPPNYPCIQPNNEEGEKEERQIKMNLHEWLDMQIVEGDNDKMGTSQARGKVMSLKDVFEFIS